VHRITGRLDTQDPFRCGIAQQQTPLDIHNHHAFAQATQDRLQDVGLFAEGLFGLGPLPGMFAHILERLLQTSSLFQGRLFLGLLQLLEGGNLVSKSLQLQVPVVFTHEQTSLDNKEE
jgi:hypothetical protein